MTAEQLACVLCGSETEHTVMVLVEWAEPVEGEVWSHVPRCVDRPACRRRVELPKPTGLGERWSINDRTPAPEELKHLDQVEPTPAAPADDEEVMPWAIPGTARRGQEAPK